MKAGIPLATTDGQTSTDRVAVTSADATATAFVDGITRCLEGHVALTKTVDNSSPKPGDTVTYTIVATNNGNSVAKSIVVTDDLTNMNVIATFQTGTLKIDNVVQTDPVSLTPMTLNLTDLAVSASHTITFQMKIKGAIVDGTAKSNTAAVTYGPGGPKTGTPPPAPPTVTVQAPLLAVTKAVDKATAKPGATLTYTVTAKNNGHSNATTVVVTDIISTLPVTYVAASVSASTDGAGTASANWTAGTKTITGQVNTLEPGKTLTVTFQVTVN